MRILLINSDQDAVEKMKSEMHDYYVVDVAESGQQGAYLSVVNDYSAIILESSLPDIQSTEVCRQARLNDVQAPIVMLMDKEDLEAKITSIDCGADLILTKPVHISEIFAYLRAFVRRNNKEIKNELLQTDDLILNEKTHEVFRNNKKIHLRKKEYQILEYLLLNKGLIISKEKLLENIWEQGLEIFSNTLEVSIKNLRNKIDADFQKKLIITVHGFGYKIESFPRKIASD